MTEIEVDTGELESSDVVIGTQPTENAAIAVVADPMGLDILDQVPPSYAPQTMVLPPPPPLLPPVDDEDEEEEEEDEEDEEPAPPPPPKPKKPVEEVLRENPEFAKEFRKTAPSAGDKPAPVAEPEKKKRRRQKPKKKPPPPPAKKEEEEEEEAEEEPEAEAEVEAEGEVEEGEEEAVPLTPQEEYIEKMRLMDEIKDFAKMGAMPPQPPNFNMPIDLLSKIRDYQASIIDETVGIGFIGMGWVGIIGLIESFNTRFDPFAKAFGTGLKLRGAKGEVEKNIHLYESTFKHIYRKLPKNKEAGPWVQLAVVTVQILASVHKKNAEQEMREEAARTLADPETARQAESFLRAKRPPAATTEGAASSSFVPPPAAESQHPITSVDSIVVSPPESEDEIGDTPSTPIHPPPPNVAAEAEHHSSGESEIAGSEEEEEDDDDDIVVQLPAKGKKK
jgi:hypothetical protein